MHQIHDRDLSRVAGARSFTGNWIGPPGVTAGQAVGVWHRYGMTRNKPWIQFMVDGIEQKVFHLVTKQ